MSGNATEQPDVEKIALDLQAKQRTLATHSDAVELTAREAQLTAVKVHLEAVELLVPTALERHNAIAQKLVDAQRDLEAAIKRENEAAAADAAEEHQG